MAKPARVSLAALAAKSSAPAPTGDTIERVPAPPPAAPPAARSPARTAKYPSVTVYLPPKAIRLVKELALDENRRMTDILAEAVSEYLVKRGHPSLDQLE